MSGIDKLLSEIGITAPPVATARDMAPILKADYHVREFAREAAQRIAKKCNLSEDSIFWLIVDEPDPEKEDARRERMESQQRDDEDDWDYDDDEEDEDED